MPTYRYDAVRVKFNNSIAVAARDGFVLDISAPSNGSFRYRITERPDNELPIIQATNNDAFSVTINGRSVLDVTQTSLGKVEWDGKTTFILAFENETGPNTDTDFFVVIGGAPLPPINNLAQWNAFNDSITSIGQGTGAFRPNKDIKFKDLKTIGQTQEDLVLGTNASESFNTGAGDDELRGGRGNDTLKGGAGDDEFFNERGNDNINGGPGFDEIDYSSAARAINADWTTRKITDGFGQMDTFASIELIRGSRFDDTFLGNGGGNQMRGLAGNDTLNGAGGADTARYDKDAEEGGAAGVRVDLTDGVAQDGFGDTDTLISIEHVFGTAKRDIITGDAKNNRLRGENGNDEINGRAGNDTILGGNGKDNIRGALGNDRLDGGSANDTLKGDAGQDTLIGGIGNDRMTGGSDADTFIFKNGFGRDVITDFAARNHSEKIDLSDVSSIRGFTDLKNNHLTQDGQNAIINDGNGNRITLLGVDVDDLGASDFIF